ncbi:MAG TPA: nucleotidyl transferase AbiEii/AbiGii toxin family protein, partial [Rhodothermales bacterium]|nr:nucleotidyl transferase AbiEii/AbiGii toxin family protein [Rhodothermales bacterium]
TPRPEYVTLPSLLDFDSPRVRAYPRETAIAEKLQAMVALGIANSRMKDYYDVWFLARTFTFNGETLARAFERTFERRQMHVPTDLPTALSPGFSQDGAKNRQWRAFLAKGRLNAPTLEPVVEHLVAFAYPPLQAVGNGEPFSMIWRPGGPWAHKRADVSSDPTGDKSK